jgi:hypothetical protein
MMIGNPQKRNPDSYAKFIESQNSAVNGPKRDLPDVEDFVKSVCVKKGYKDAEAYGIDKNTSESKIASFGFEIERTV